MYHGYLNVSGVPVVLGGTSCVRGYKCTCLCQRYTSLFQEDLFMSEEPACLCQGYLFEGGVDLGEQPVASCKAPDGVDPVPPSVVVLMLLELSGQ